MIYGPFGRVRNIWVQPEEHDFWNSFTSETAKAVFRHSQTRSQIPVLLSSLKDAVDGGRSLIPTIRAFSSRNSRPLQNKSTYTSKLSNIRSTSFFPKSVS
jgi:hypothetical protein